MPVTPETLQQAMRLRSTVNTHVDTVVGQQTRSWARLWNELARDWAVAVDQILATERTGRLTKAQLFRLTKVRHALSVSLEALDQLAVQAGQEVIHRIPRLVADASAHELSVIESQLPGSFGGRSSLTDAPAAAIDAIVRRATQQVTSLVRPLSDDAYQVMLAEVQRGVALGVNPKTAAVRMLQRTKGGFDGGLSRANRIARTEMLDAYRAAAQTTDQANTGVLAGWRWSCSLSPRTCPACLAMNGQQFPTSTPGPLGHVNCRCARVPVAKSWHELGFPGLNELPDHFPDARSWFDGLSPQEQVRIMGPTRLRLLQSGQITWDDLAVKHRNPNWRPSYQPRTLTNLRRTAQTA